MSALQSRMLMSRSVHRTSLLQIGTPSSAGMFWYTHQSSGCTTMPNIWHATDASVRVQPCKNTTVSGLYSNTKPRYQFAPSIRSINPPHPSASSIHPHVHPSIHPPIHLSLHSFMNSLIYRTTHTLTTQ